MTSRVPSPPPRRRYDRVGGTVLAVLGVAVAVVAVIALRHPNGRQARPVSLRTTATATITASPTPSSSAPSTHSLTPSSPGSVAARSVPLMVLNNTSTEGLATTAKQRFEAAGWTVTSTGNIVNDILSTCAYYDPSDPANQQAALELQREFPAIKRVKERFPELPPGPIVVVLTTDYS
jgi:LytR cell envelope-related transcriptional attenuator